mgnify:CR=1 FL=1
MFPEFGQLKNGFGQLKNDFGQLKNQVNGINQLIQKPKPACQFGLFIIKGTLSQDFSYTYSPAFTEKPAVVWGFEYMDLWNQRQIRLAAFATEYTRFKLGIRIHTWEDSSLHMASLRWMACPKTI